MSLPKTRPPWVRTLSAYWVVDGLPDLLVGCAFVVDAGWQTLTTLRPTPSLPVRLAFVLFVLAIAFGGRWLIQQAKWRLTYPRTGYVRYRPIFPRRQFYLLAAASLLFTAWLVFKAPQRILPLGIAAMLTAIFVWVGWHNLSKRYFLYAALAILSGGLSWWAAPAVPQPLAALLQVGTGVFLAVGLGLLGGGSLTLWRYLQLPSHQDDPDHA